MKVIKAAALGMCFGVRDAIAIAIDQPSPTDVTIHGSLVHNEEVTGQLTRRGFAINPETDRARIPDTPQVLITAHGISHRERARLRAAGKTLIDTTCPLVRRVHQAAQALERAGFFVLIIGRRGHVEVQGIVGDLQRCEVVAAPDEVRPYDVDRIGVICQSTTPPTLAEAVLARVRAVNAGKQIRYIPTMCRPTLDRQQAMLDLLPRIDALVVVGGKDSNNTHQLANLARSRGKPAFHVQSAADLDPRALAPHRVVGLTAGTSTPDSVIESVYQHLLSFNGEHCEVISVSGGGGDRAL